MPTVEPRPDVHDTPNRRGSGISAQATRELKALVSAAVEPAGFDLEDLTISSAGRRRVVRVIVDSDAGVDLDDIAALSREISAALDDEAAVALIDGAYQLEVSSPGVDRPLTEPRHWRRAVGRLVQVEMAGEATLGRVLSADTSGVAFSVDGDSHAVGWSDLGPGRVQVEFNRGGGDSRAAAQTGEG
jgi:ribosome maturation factor RimP